MNKIPFLNKLMAKPSFMDAMVLCIFTIFITWHPYFLHGQINLFELGLYLPGIDAIRHGQIPFRDFFYLRGPFELYVPAFLMNVFGSQVAVLSSYFYIGTVILFLIAVLIACVVIENRFVLYCAIPVLIARTFPRVVFTYWGGMRFAIGLLGVYCLIRFCKEAKNGWLIAVGVLAALGLLTSLEIGVCLIAATGSMLLFRSLAQRENLMRPLLIWVSAVAAIGLPYVIYMWSNGALAAWVDCTTTVATRMSSTFLQTETVPRNIGEVIQALFIPTNDNFRQMTPLFCYFIFAGYVIRQWQQRRINYLDQAAVVIAVYGLTMYVLAFRNLWASQFEMALIPSKLILFFLIGKGLVWMLAQARLSRQATNTVVMVLLLAIFATSIPYAISRFQKRFFVFQALSRKHHRDALPLKGETMQVPQVSRLRSMRVSSVQAQDLALLNGYLEQNSATGEIVFMFPELGAVSYIVNHPSVGRFATATMSWFKEDWYEEMKGELSQHPPHLAVVQKQAPDYFKTAYFPVAANLRYYNETLDFIQSHYTPVFETPSYRVWRYNS